MKKVIDRIAFASLVGLFASLAGVVISMIWINLFMTQFFGTFAVISFAVFGITLIWD